MDKAVTMIHFNRSTKVELTKLRNELTGFLNDDNYTRYPRNVHKPLVPLNLIQFFVRDKDVIV